MLGNSLLSIKQVADYLGRSEAHVRRLIRRNELKAFDINAEPGSKSRRSSWMIDPADVRLFLDTRRNGAVSDQPKPARRRPVGPAKRFI